MQVLAGNYDDYRQRVNWLYALRPPAIQAWDWNLNFAPGTAFDNNIASTLGNNPVGYPRSGPPTFPVVVFTNVAPPSLRLLQLDYLVPGQAAVVLWIAAVQQPLVAPVPSGSPVPSVTPVPLRL